MTEIQVQKALESAVREAFNLGVRSQREKRNPTQQSAMAQSYAADLVLPSMRLALDQAREEGWIAAIAAVEAGIET